MLIRNIALTACGLLATLSFNTVAAGDPTTGVSAFSVCSGCHSVNATAHSPAGPHLQGVVGRPAGSVEGGLYSAAMKQSGIVWDAENLDAFLENPSEYLPGTYMTVGESDEGIRGNIIAYLKSLASM